MICEQCSGKMATKNSRGSESANPQHIPRWLKRTKMPPYTWRERQCKACGANITTIEISTTYFLSLSDFHRLSKERIEKEKR